MKHSLTITLLLISFFVLAQVFGLFLIMQDAQVVTTTVNGTTTTAVAHEDTAVGARPELSGGASLLYVAAGVAIGTLLVLLLARFGKTGLWKVWYFLAVWMASAISLGVLIKYSILFTYSIAIGIALGLTIWKVFWPNIFIHNITEVLVYSGIALLIVPLFDLYWAIALLLLIALYDMYAVWKSKHMITLAKFQTKSNVFAGLMIPYKKQKIGVAKVVATKSSAKIAKPPVMKKGMDGPKIAILGGGDIAFPLIFTGVVFESLLREGLSKSSAYMQSSIIIVTSTIALTLLFIYAKKGKFYPAMPFLTAGCLVGWGITLLF